MLERLAGALNKILHPSMLALVGRRDNPPAGCGDIVGAVTSSVSAGQSISAAELRALRLRGQLLTGPQAASVAAAAVHLGGLQAQAAPPAQLAVRARTSGLATADVDRACGASREVTRTWAMRGTLHILATRDVRWMTGLFGPLVAGRGRRRRAQLGLDDGLCERALAALAVILAGSHPLTRAELVSRLAGEGVQIALRTQQPPHLLGYAAGRGLICRGPDRPGRASPPDGPDGPGGRSRGGPGDPGGSGRVDGGGSGDPDAGAGAGGEPTYVLLDEWAPHAPALGRPEALAELARRYLGGYGPASREDFTAWSGLPAAECTRALDLLAGDLVAVSAAGTRLFALAGHAVAEPADPPPRLLGQFDPYLLGYRDRGLVLDAGYAPRIQTGGGFVHSVVLIGGRVAGTWRLTRAPGRARRARLTVEPFMALPADGTDGLASEAADIGRFLGLDVSLETAAT